MMRDYDMTRAFQTVTTKDDVAKIRDEVGRSVVAKVHGNWADALGYYVAKRAERDAVAMYMQAYNEVPPKSPRLVETSTNGDALICVWAFA